MFGGLGWMGMLVAALAAVGVLGYLLVVLQCAEEELREQVLASGAGERAGTDAAAGPAGEPYDRPARRAA